MSMSQSLIRHVQSPLFSVSVTSPLHCSSDFDVLSRVKRGIPRYRYGLIWPHSIDVVAPAYQYIQQTAFNQRTHHALLPRGHVRPRWHK